MKEQQYPALGKTAKSKGLKIRWKIGILALTALFFALSAAPAARAQGTVRIVFVTTVPAACNANGNNSPVMWWKVGGTNPGLYTCISGVPTYQTNTFGAGLTAKTMIYANSTPAIVSTVAPTNGQLLIGDTGNVPALGTVAGTTNETLITNAAHAITVGLAATLNHKVGTSFNFQDPADTTKVFQFVASGITTGNTRTVTLPDSNTTIPIAAQILTFTGPSAARTYTLPDAATTLAGIATIQTLTNKTSIHGGANTNVFADNTDTTKLARFDLSGITTGTTRVLTLPDSNTTLPIAAQIITFAGPSTARTYTLPDAATTLAGIATAQTLTNKTIIMGGVSTNLFADSADTTKQFQFDLTNVGTSSIKSVVVPNQAAMVLPTGLTAVDSLVVNALGASTGVLGTATVEARLSTTAAVDMNTGTATTLYTSPTGRSTIVTKVVVSTCSTSMTTASYSFGWTSAAFADVIANATHTELTGATLYTSLGAKVGSTIGTSTGTFKVLMNTLQGGAATCKMDVFGYTF